MLEATAQPEQGQHTGYGEVFVPAVSCVTQSTYSGLSYEEAELSPFCFSLGFPLCADTAVRSTGECLWKELL